MVNAAPVSNVATAPPPSSSASPAVAAAALAAPAWAPPSPEDSAPPSPVEPRPLEIVPDSAPELRAEPASLWRRLFAFLIDAALVGGVWWLFLFAAAAVIGLKAEPTHLIGLDDLMARLHAYQPVMLPGAVLGALLAGTYCAAFAFLRGGRTLGRWVLGLRLVDARGLPPSPLRAVLRAVLAVFSFALFLVGFWLALFDRRGQALHDKLTRTFVIHPL